MSEFNLKFEKGNLIDEENILKKSGWEKIDKNESMSMKMKELSVFKLEDLITIIIDTKGTAWIQGGNENTPDGVKIKQRIIYRLVNKEKNMWETVTTK